MWQKHSLDPVWQEIFLFFGLQYDVPGYQEPLVTPKKGKKNKSKGPKPLESVTPKKGKKNKSQDSKPLESPEKHQDPRKKPRRGDAPEGGGPENEDPSKKQRAAPEGGGPAPAAAAKDDPEPAASGTGGEPPSRVNETRPVKFGQPRTLNSTLKAVAKRKKANPEPEQPVDVLDGILANPDQDLEIFDEDDEMKKKPRIMRSSHSRVTKKCKSVSELKNQAVKFYLSDIGVNWGTFQKIHTRCFGSSCCLQSQVDLKNHE